MYRTKYLELFAFHDRVGILFTAQYIYSPADHVRSYQERSKMENVAIMLRSRMLTYWYGKKERLVYDHK